jgi:hypothetical protein
MRELYSVTQIRDGQEDIHFYQFRLMPYKCLGSPGRRLGDQPWTGKRGALQNSAELARIRFRWWGRSTTMSPLYKGG